MAKEQGKRTETRNIPREQKQNKNSPPSKVGKNGKIMVECKFGSKCTKGKQCRFLHTHKEEKKELTGREQKNEQKKMKLEHKLKRPDGELVFKAKEIWNRLRLIDIEMEERNLLVLKLMTLLKGKVVDISLKHDGSRIIQSLYKYGNPEQRSSLTKEILKSVVVMSKTKHGRFLVQSLLRYGSKDDIDAFLKAIAGKVQSLAIHQIASHVIEYAYEEILTQRQSFLLFEELYHRQYINLKDTESTTAKQIADKNPLLRDKILANLFVVITKLINKGLLDNSYAHKILYDYLTIAYPKRIMMLMDQVDNAFPALSTTHLGSQFIIEGLNYCSNKNKRKILKSYKGIIADTAVHQFGYMIIIKLLYCIDDTVLLNKTIFKELSVSYQQLLESSYGCRVLLSLLSPKNHSYFEDEGLFVVPAFTIKNEKGEKEEILTAKKDYDTRVKELREKLDLVPALLGSFSTIVINFSTIHVIAESIVKSDEEKAKILLEAFRGCIEKSLETPALVLSADVHQQDLVLMEEEELEEMEEMEEEGEGEEGEDGEEEAEGEDGEDGEEESEGEEEEGEGEDGEEETEPTQNKVETETANPTYGELWNNDAWIVLCKRIISLLAESDTKSLLLSEIVTPMKDKFMSLIQVYPTSLFFIRKLMKCEVTSKEMIACLKSEKKTLSKLFASGNYKGYDDVMAMLGKKK